MLDATQQSTTVAAPGHGMHKTEVINGAPANDSSTGFRFSRLFPNAPGFNISPDAALALGAAMTSVADAPNGDPLSRRDSPIPAGYTYFGQFIDHDITRDVTGDDDALSDGMPPAMTALRQFRSPTLDLDSVYGATPADSKGGTSPRTGPNFIFEMTEPSQGQGRSGESLPFDLPRTDDGRVLIPDDRNDENLIVGQMHLAWMKFHNAVVSKLKSQDLNLADDQAFQDARTLVTQHYQHIVLFDFLKRICDPKVHQTVVAKQKPHYCAPTAGEAVEMPLEFAAAAFRFGHTMIRQLYNWNVNFSFGAFGPATFDPASNPFSLFKFTNRTLTKSAPLPTNWIADWRRLLDFSGTGADDGGITPTPSAAFDPYLAPGMGTLGREMTGGPSVLNNLAASNMRRAALRGVPSGQDVSREMSTVKMLTKAEMKQDLDPNMQDLVDTLELDVKAPLWFYILQEANARASGAHLGEMGSQIVCETFMALVKGSKPSITQSGWTPEDSPLRLANGNTVGDLPSVFVFCEENGFPLINPLEA
ncbi:MAG: peroxidase family protein [Pseudomonadota bacterium]